MIKNNMEKTNKKIVAFTCEWCKTYLPNPIYPQENETPHQAKLRHIKNQHPRIFKKYYKEDYDKEFLKGGLKK